MASFWLPLCGLKDFSSIRLQDSHCRLPCACEMTSRTTFQGSFAYLCVRIWDGVGFGVRVSEIKRSKSNYLVNIFVSHRVVPYDDKNLVVLFPTQSTIWFSAIPRGGHLQEMPAHETRFDSLDFENPWHSGFWIWRVPSCRRRKKRELDSKRELGSKVEAKSTFLPRKQWDGSILTTSKVRCQLF